VPGVAQPSFLWGENGGKMWKTAMENLWKIDVFHGEWLGSFANCLGKNWKTMESCEFNDCEKLFQVVSLL
jgi:hypothetical protein